MNDLKGSEKGPFLAELNALAFLGWRPRRQRAVEQSNLEPLWLIQAFPPIPLFLILPLSLLPYVP